MISELSSPSLANGNSPLQTQPDYWRGEIAYLARTEKVVHLDDFLLRRSSLAMLGKVTAGLLEELATIIGEVCGWSVAEQANEVARAKALLAENHRVEL